MENILIPAGKHDLTGVLHRSTIPSKKTLIISHGFRGSKDGGGRAITLAKSIAVTGFNVIRYDFTPLQTLSSQIAELTAVVLYTRKIVGQEIFLLGRSMGGSASISVAARDQNIRGLILWATPLDLPTTFRLALGSTYDRLSAGENVSLMDEYGCVCLTPGFIQDFSTHNLPAYIEQLHSTPLLILHGTDDAIVPISQAQAIYDLAPYTKEFVLFTGDDHHLAASTFKASSKIIDWLHTIC